MNARLPQWFNQKVPDAQALEALKYLLDGLNLNTICESAQCPNIGECFSKGTATFLILGNICSRNCTFCAVKKGQPLPVDADEPYYISEAIEKLRLRYAVITSVTRDDLADGGASHFVEVIRILRQNSDVKIEVLIPDFQGSVKAISLVSVVNPDVINHNIETVPRLYCQVRPQADYCRSLDLIRTVKQINADIHTKSGIMVGLGETRDEVLSVMRDLRSVGCDYLTIGQYLAPSSFHHPVIRYVHPDEFEMYKMDGMNMGFHMVFAGPFVRSSHNASEMNKKNFTRMI